MDRRQFLGAAAGAGAIGWLSHYFLGAPAWAGDDEKAIARMGNVSEAYGRAAGLRKPLLVLVIPAKDDQKWGRGQVFGALLNHGGPGVYLDLALCEVVCATVADAKAQIKDLMVEGEPLMLLVETGGAAARATAIDPQIRDDFGARDFDKVDELAKERLDVVAAALRAGVLPTKETLAARAALAEARLPAEEAKSLRAAVAAGKTPEPEALDRGAALVRALAEAPDAPRPQILSALAAAAQKRVTGTAPPGAKWAKSSGCGVDIEDEETTAVKCGMGYVPKISQRFLWFFTK
ncbi:MAG: hypothetical protein ACHQ1G_09555 [Planctomycetota bacterium]